MPLIYLILGSCSRTQPPIKCGYCGKNMIPPQNDPLWGRVQKLIMVKSEGSPLCIHEHSSDAHLLFPYEELEGSQAVGWA